MEKGKVYKKKKKKKKRKILLDHSTWEHRDGLDRPNIWGVEGEKKRKERDIGRILSFSEEIDT